MTLLWVFVRIIILAYLFSILLDIKKMKQGAEEIAAGNLEYKIEADTMNSGLKKYADYLNNIGEALNVALEKRIQSERMKTELITNVSHDIKTPLTSISGYAEIMKSGMVNREDMIVFSERIYKEASRMITLIDDIIKLSRLDEDSVEVEREEVDLYEMCQDIVERLSMSAEKRNVHVELNGESTAYYGVKQMLDEMIFNLCENALP